MTGLTLQIDDRPVLDALRELSRRVQHLRPAMEQIGAKLESSVNQRFDTKTDPAGHPWAAWKPSTEKRHVKANRGSLLEMYGTLLQSLNHQADEDSVIVGFGAPYAVYHEFGTKHMERRGMLSADPDAGTLGRDDQAAVLDIITGYLAKAV